MASNSKLELADCTCPVCMYILIEPVTMPCGHELCMPCFETNVQETSLLCPMCRLRIASWARRAARNKKLVNQKRWEEIQLAFPKKVKCRLDGREDEYSSSSDEDLFVGVHHLAESGEIKKEYEEEMKKLAEERDRQKKEEELASEKLIRDIQAQELSRQLEQERLQLTDESLAKELSSRLNQLSSTPSRTVSSSSTITKTPTAPKTPTILDKFIQKGAADARNRNNNSASKQVRKDPYPYTCYSPTDTGKIISADMVTTDTYPFVDLKVIEKNQKESGSKGENKEKTQQQLQSKVDKSAEQSILDYIFIDSRPQSQVEVDKDQSVVKAEQEEGKGDGLFVGGGHSGEGFGKITSKKVEKEVKKKSQLQNWLKDNDDKFVTSVSESIASMSKSSHQLDSTTEVAISLIDKEDTNSIDTELNHFRPVKAFPRTPPHRLPGGDRKDPPIIFSTPRNLKPNLTLKGFEPPENLNPAKLGGSPTMQRRILELQAERQVQVQMHSKGTSTNVNQSSAVSTSSSTSLMSPSNNNMTSSPKKMTSPARSVASLWSGFASPKPPKKTTTLFELCKKNTSAAAASTTAESMTSVGTNSQQADSTTVFIHDSTDEDSDDVQYLGTSQETPPVIVEETHKQPLLPILPLEHNIGDDDMLSEILDYTHFGGYSSSAQREDDLTKTTSTLISKDDETTTRTMKSDNTNTSSFLSHQAQQTTHSTTATEQSDHLGDAFITSENTRSDAANLSFKFGATDPTTQSSLLSATTGTEPKMTSFSNIITPMKSEDIDENQDILNIIKGSKDKLNKILDKKAESKSIQTFDIKLMEEESKISSTVSPGKIYRMKRKPKSSQTSHQNQSQDRISEGRSESLVLKSEKDCNAEDVKYIAVKPEDEVDDLNMPVISPEVNVQNWLDTHPQILEHSYSKLGQVGEDVVSSTQQDIDSDCESGPVLSPYHDSFNKQKVMNDLTEVLQELHNSTSKGLSPISKHRNDDELSISFDTKRGKSPPSSEKSKGCRTRPDSRKSRQSEHVSSTLSPERIKSQSKSSNVGNCRSPSHSHSSIREVSESLLLASPVSDDCVPTPDHFILSPSKSPVNSTPHKRPIQKNRKRGRLKHSPAKTLLLTNSSQEKSKESPKKLAKQSPRMKKLSDCNKDKLTTSKIKDIRVLRKSPLKMPKLSPIKTKINQEGSFRKSKTLSTPKKRKLSENKDSSASNSKGKHDNYGTESSPGKMPKLSPQTANSRRKQTMPKLTPRKKYNMRNHSGSRKSSSDLFSDDYDGQVMMPSPRKPIRWVDEKITVGKTKPKQGSDIPFSPIKDYEKTFTPKRVQTEICFKKNDKKEASSKIEGNTGKTTPSKAGKPTTPQSSGKIWNKETPLKTGSVKKVTPLKKAHLAGPVRLHRNMKNRTESKSSRKQSNKTADLSVESDTLEDKDDVFSLTTKSADVVANKPPVFPGHKSRSRSSRTVKSVEKETPVKKRKLDTFEHNKTDFTSEDESIIRRRTRNTPREVIQKRNTPKKTPSKVKTCDQSEDEHIASRTRSRTPVKNIMPCKLRKNRISSLYSGDESEVESVSARTRSRTPIKHMLDRSITKSYRKRTASVRSGDESNCESIASHTHSQTPVRNMFKGKSPRKTTFRINNNTSSQLGEMSKCESQIVKQIKPVKQKICTRRKVSSVCTGDDNSDTLSDAESLSLSSRKRPIKVVCAKQRANSHRVGRRHIEESDCLVSDTESISSCTRQRSSVRDLQSDVESISSYPSVSCDRSRRKRHKPGPSPRKKVRKTDVTTIQSDHISSSQQPTTNLSSKTNKRKMQGRSITHDDKENSMDSMDKLAMYVEEPIVNCQKSLFIKKELETMIDEVSESLHHKDRKNNLLDRTSVKKKDRLKMSEVNNDSGRKKIVNDIVINKNKRTSAQNTRSKTVKNQMYSQELKVEETGKKDGTESKITQKLISKSKVACKKTVKKSSNSKSTLQSKLSLAAGVKKTTQTTLTFVNTNSEDEFENDRKKVTKKLTFTKGDRSKCGDNINVTHVFSPSPKKRTTRLLKSSKASQSNIKKSGKVKTLSNETDKKNASCSSLITRNESETGNHRQTETNNNCDSCVLDHIRRDPSEFKTEALYQNYIEEQDRLFALKLQADFDLEVKFGLNAIRRTGSVDEYKLRRKKSS